MGRAPLREDKTVNRIAPFWLRCGQRDFSRNIKIQSWLLNEP
jgi:hypothetical protein